MCDKVVTRLLRTYNLVTTLLPGCYSYVTRLLFLYGELLGAMLKVNKLTAFTIILRGEVPISDLIEFIEIVEDATGGTGRPFSLNITEHSRRKGKLLALTVTPC